MFGVMENSGKTPAVQMVVNSVWTDRKAADPVPDYDTVEQEMSNQMRRAYEVPSWVPPEVASDISKTIEVAKRQTSPTPTVLPPGVARPLPIISSAKMGRNIGAQIIERKIFYVVGKITYYGTDRKAQYATSFCLMNDFGANFRFCPTGNDMK